MKKYLLPFVVIFLQNFLCHGQNIFSNKLDTNFVTSTLKVPVNLSYDILCISEDCTAYDPETRKYGAIKGSFGDVAYMPAAFSTEGDSIGYILVTHQMNNKNENLGNGGGMLQFKVKRKPDGHWAVENFKIGAKKVYYKNINFEQIGGTVGNSSILINKYLPNEKTVLVGEGMYQSSNEELSTGYTDISDYTLPVDATQEKNPYYVVPANTTIKRYQNMNWMIEVDVESATPLRKHYTMGRFAHSRTIKAFGGYIMTSGNNPSILLKFQPFDENDLSIGGELFAFKQNEDGTGGFDISLNNIKRLPDGTDSTYQHFDSLLVLNDQALRAGATMFANLRGLILDEIEGVQVLYIAEGGVDNSDDMFTNPAKMFKGVLANHLKELDAKDGVQDGVFSDYNGRILSLVDNGKLSVLLEGGASTDGKVYFSNPDGLNLVNGGRDENFNTKRFFIIKENINGVDKGRNPAFNTNVNNKINEVFYVNAPVTFDEDYNPQKIGVDELNIFLIGPKGSVINGGTTYDPTMARENPNTYFLSINTPNTNNTTPNNRSMIVAVTELSQSTAVDQSKSFDKKIFKIWPNPVSKTLFLNEKTDVGIYSVDGTLLKVKQAVEEIEMSEFQPGIYFIKNLSNQTIKLVIE